MQRDIYGYCKSEAFRFVLAQGKGHYVYRIILNRLHLQVLVPLCIC